MGEDIRIKQKIAGEYPIEITPDIQLIFKELLNIESALNKVTIMLERDLYILTEALLEAERQGQLCPDTLKHLKSLSKILKAQISIECEEKKLFDDFDKRNNIGGKK